MIKFLRAQIVFHTIVQDSKLTTYGEKKWCMLFRVPIIESRDQADMRKNKSTLIGF